MIKHQFGFTKTRYRGLMKNTVQVNMLVGLANLYLLRWRLMAPERRSPLAALQAGDEAEKIG
jgi:hypothetical protein